MRTAQRLPLSAAMHPRIVVSGATLSVARRTTMRKAFLAPWHSMVTQVWLYVLAEAQQITDVAVHLTNLVVSHHHTDITLERPNLGEFLRHLHRETSCALNTLMIAERYDAPREVFDDRSCHAMRLMDAGAQMTQLVYGRNNCVAAGLVQRPEHMPGNVVDFDLWKRGVVVVKKPPFYFGKHRAEEIELRVTPPPLLMQAFDGDLDRLVYHMNRLTEDAGQALRAAREHPAMGAQKVQRIHPWNEPRTLREPGGNRVPTFRIGSRGIIAREHDKAARHETREFRHEHEEVRVARREGDTTGVFPFGTYGARVVLKAPCASQPKDTAFVTKPGPLLRDVMEELAKERCHEQRQHTHTASVDLLEEARAAFVDESDEVVEHDAMIFDEGPRSAAASRSNSTANTHAPQPSPERAERVVQHRFARRDDDPESAPRRIVTLRDARKGRPRRPTGKHGADPPA